MRILRGAFVAAVAAAAALALVAAAVLRPPSPLPSPARGAHFGRVHLVEPGGARRAAVSLHVEGARIARIGAPVRSDDAFADAYVLPGLSDLHVHLPALHVPGDDAYTLALLLAHGVTQIRIAGGTPPAQARALRARIAAGDLAGPRIFSCGPFLDGADPVLPGAREIRTPQAARAAVAELAAEGVDCIKAYDRLDLPATTALREAAHAHGLPLIGHTPQALTLEQARLDDVQHLRGVYPPFENEGRSYPAYLRVWHRFDAARLRHVVEVSRRHGMAYTPTLVAVEGTLRARDPAWRRGPTMRLWMPHLRDGFWSRDVGLDPTRFMRAADFEMVAVAFERMRAAVAGLHAAGIALHTGTDCNAPNVVPGASLQREIALLADAGLGAEAALEASTRRSARFLGIEDAGTLRVGAPAELAVFRDDPTRDAAALASLVAVVRDGRLYTKSDLDARLARLRAHYEGAGFRHLVMPVVRGVVKRISARVVRRAAGADAAAAAPQSE